MQSKMIQVAGLAFPIAYAVFIVWIYATEPRTFKEVATSAEVAAGTYQLIAPSLLHQPARLPWTIRTCACTALRS